jgi:hypothetical protein
MMDCLVQAPQRNLSNGKDRQFDTHMKAFSRSAHQPTPIPPFGIGHFTSQRWTRRIPRPVWAFDPMESAANDGGLSWTGL